MSDTEPLKDPGLSQLREQTKNIMIPLLIKIFQIRQEAQQAKAPPSRLTHSSPTSSLEELSNKLSALNEDLRLQMLWIESSRTQIEKVLAELQNPVLPLKNPVGHSPSNPAIQKSFTKALAPLKNTGSFLDRIKKILRL